MVGIATASIYSGVLVAQIPLSKELKQSVEFLHTSQADNHLRTTAAELIQTAWRVHVVKRARNRLAPGAVSVGAHNGIQGAFVEGDVIMDRETAKEQATQNAGLSRFGLDSTNKGHKADRLYFAIKQFRYARKQVQGAFTQANDVVVNQKMDSLMALSHAIKREMVAHQNDFETLEKEILQEFNLVTQQVLHYKRLGHAPI
jgi:hypothetical protein